jgi:competence protein ComEC
VINGPTVPACFLAGVVLSYGWFLAGWPLWLAWIVLPLHFFLHSWLLRFNALKLAVTCCGFLLCGHVLQASLADRYTQTGPPDIVTVQGRVIGLPEAFDDYTRFRFHTLQSVNKAQQPSLPTLLLVKWYRNPPDIQAGQEWELELQIKPPRGLVNFQGQDRERWLFAEGIGGLGSVRQGRLLSTTSMHGWLDRTRQKLSDGIARVPDLESGAGMVRALAVADRSGLSRQERETLTITGTSHLLAISGLHVGLAYALAYWLARLLTFPFERFLRNQSSPCMLIGWLAAACYAGLAGFSTSTIRALIMLSVALLALLVRRRIPPIQSLLLALALVILLDPLAPLKAGAWMSFLAVAALLLWFVPRQGHSGNRLMQLVQAQFAVTTLSFPMTAWWFQVSSPAGFWPTW